MFFCVSPCFVAGTCDMNCSVTGMYDFCQPIMVFLNTTKRPFWSICTANNICSLSLCLFSYTRCIHRHVRRTRNKLTFCTALIESHEMIARERISKRRDQTSSYTWHSNAQAPAHDQPTAPVIAEIKEERVNHCNTTCLTLSSAVSAATDCSTALKAL